MSVCLEYPMRGEEAKVMDFDERETSTRR